MRLADESKPVLSPPENGAPGRRALGLNKFLRKMRRQVYRTRLFIPGLRERHLLETMIGPVGAWDELQAYQLNVLRENGLKPEHRLLDIGCGPLQGGVAFIGYLEKGRYVGVDRSSRHLSAAYGLIQKHHLSDKNPLLIMSDAFGQVELADRQFDYFWASQILYYFDEEMLSRLFDFVMAHMAPEGKFLGDIIGENHPDFRNPEAIERLRSPLQLHRVGSIANCAEAAGLKVRSLGEIVNFGYPKRLNLRTNVLIEVTPAYASALRQP